MLLRVCSQPFGIPNENVGVRGAAPEPGEHTTEVLSAAGYSADELAALEAAGVVGHRPMPGSPLERWGETLRAATAGGD